jgi:rhodanese-related sulfurtransferase
MDHGKPHIVFPPRAICCAGILAIAARDRRILIARAGVRPRRAGPIALERLGYTNVMVYAGGKQDWLAAGLPIERGIGAAA